MCGKETEEQRLAREAQEGMGSTKEHFGKRFVDSFRFGQRRNCREIASETC